MTKTENLEPRIKKSELKIKISSHFTASPLHRFTHSPIHPFTDKNGFTLMETIMVMVIAVILAAVVAVRWSPFETIKLDSATRKVAADIRYAQKVAISTQNRAGIEFTANGYCVFNDITLRTGTCLPSGALESSPGDPCATDSSNKFVVDFTADRCSNYSGVTITIPTSLTNDVLQFNSLGTPLEGTSASVFNADPETITIWYKGNSKSIYVYTGTGRVSY